MLPRSLVRVEFALLQILLAKSMLLWYTIY
jgi:hypothetical protein